MILPDFLQQDSSGEIRLKHHRIGLFHVVHYYGEGHSPEMLVSKAMIQPFCNGLNARLGSY